MILDKEQKAAVETKKRKVLVASNAGSGKTRCIVERLRFLLNNGVDPSKIFAITYTNAAAQEMRDRIGNSEIFIGTIHSLANRILLLNGVDTSDCLNEEEFDKLFELIKKENIELPEVEHLLIDEFQDICDNEYEFTMEILKPKNFYLVGDSCQSIYKFKGSNYKYFMDLINNPFVEVYELNNNYRCGEEIINFAEIFLDKCHDIYRIACKCKSNIIGEVEKIPFSFDAILEYLKEDNYKDWFILCRTNQEIDAVICFLKENNIPCVNFRKSELSLKELNEKVNSDVVKVLTIHSAKGLESKNVIVIGARPFKEEECRVCYVAATRAKEKLIWMIDKPKKKTNNKMKKWG